MTTSWSSVALWADESVPDRDLPAYLAACRRGLGKPPGTVPEMWPLHRLTASGGDETARSRAAFDAEHHTLSLWAIHQQGQIDPAGRFLRVHAREHTDGVGLGHVIGALHRPGPDGRPPFNDAAIETRFHRMVVAQTLDDLVIHLRGLLTQIRQLRPLRPCNYDQLWRDLAVWDLPDRQLGIRRRWGREYQQALDRQRNPKVSQGADL
jgi:CRISPR system Cascade subunit CasB